MIRELGSHGGSTGPDVVSFARAVLTHAAQFLMIMVGEGIALSTTTPEPDMIVSHHPALQCMVTCD